MFWWIISHHSTINNYKIDYCWELLHKPMNLVGHFNQYHLFAFNWEYILASCAETCDLFCIVAKFGLVEKSSFLEFRFCWVKYSSCYFLDLWYLWCTQWFNRMWSFWVCTIPKSGRSAEFRAGGDPKFVPFPSHCVKIWKWWDVTLYIHIDQQPERGKPWATAMLRSSGA